MSNSKSTRHVEYLFEPAIYAYTYSCFVYFSYTGTAFENSPLLINFIVFSALLDFLKSKNCGIRIESSIR